ncbi:MAG: CPBP family intramembrane metalloprotease [Lachnospiraceae bacterium]|nr:CPBP family intramembrane metalloprotease [Lachnospiraceae bacterium]
MKKTVLTVMKFIGFFLGWAIFVAVLPLSSSKNPAIWRLWAELMPLLAIILFTLIFWFMEKKIGKKKVRLHLFDHPVNGLLLGVLAGAAWLGVSVLGMYLSGSIHMEGTNSIHLFPVWLTAAFLNVVMQELLVRGYLYQMVKQKHNIIAATIATTVLFTALHGGAFEAGIIPVCNVLTMSLLMTIVLEYSGSIIAPTIMHFLWNGIGAVVLGGVSLAEDYPSLFMTSFTGNDILSGGACKMEGSIIVFFANVILMALFIMAGFRKKTRSSVYMNGLNGGKL